MALAGGVAITVPIQSGAFTTRAACTVRTAPPAPRCRKQGTCFSDGAGMVVLKRLEDAERDRDQIHAVIKGAA